MGGVEGHDAQEVVVVVAAAVVLATDIVAEGRATEGRTVQVQWKALPKEHSRVKKKKKKRIQSE